MNLVCCLTGITIPEPRPGLGYKPPGASCLAVAGGPASGERSGLRSCSQFHYLFSNNWSSQSNPNLQAGGQQTVKRAIRMLESFHRMAEIY